MFQFFKNEKFQSYVSYPFLILLIVLFIHSKAYTFDFSIRLSDYLYSSWLFSYEFGFMQRGLIGEILRNLGIPRDYKTIRIIAIIIYLTLFYCYYLLIYKSFKKLELDHKTIGIYSACILFLSYAAPQFIHEISRFDQIFQILLLTFTLILIRKTKISLSFIYIILIIPFIALTHEAGLIIFLPTIWLLFYINYKNKVLTSIIVIFTFISLILISVFGKISTHQADALVEHYSQYKYFNEYAFRTSTLSLTENLNVNFWAFIDGKMYIPILFCLIYLYPLFIFLKNSISTKIPLWTIIFIASPLSLFIIAFDYFRWISLFLFNLTVFLTYLANTNQLDLSKLNDNFVKYRKSIIAYGLISLFLGPLGVVNLFSNFHSVNTGGFSGSHISDNIKDKLK